MIKINRPSTNILTPSKKCFVLLCTVITLLSACQSSSATDSTLATPLVVQLSWTHSAQFAGLYMAQQNGYYAEEGLDVTFVEGGLLVERLPSVLDGVAQIGIASPSELITARAAGSPVRAIAVIYRRDPLVYFALADSGITSPEDFVGKRILVPVPARPIFHSLMAHVGVAPEQYTEVSDMDHTALFSGDLDVAVGFVTTQVLELQQEGYELNLIHPDNYGVHFYTDTLFTTDAYIASNPDVITRFLRATFQGWRDAIEAPESAGEFVLIYNPDADTAYESASMVASIPYINTGEDYIGWMQPGVWDGMVQTLREENVLITALDVADLYTMEFLQQIYGESSP